MTRIISCGLDVCACVVVCYIAAHVHAARRYICGLRIYIYTVYMLYCELHTGGEKLDLRRHC